MITLLPIYRIISVVAIIYALIVVGVLFLVTGQSGGLSLYSGLKIALAGATALNFVLLGSIYFAWRWLWRKFPSLNVILFPDLNGSWDMKIHWSGPSGNGIVNASAQIRQNFLRISMEVYSAGSDSETLIAQPKKHSESGRPILYYVYRVVPKQIQQKTVPTYEGSAILSFSESEGGLLHGNYFTSERTSGHFTLNRSIA